MEFFQDLMAYEFLQKAFITSIMVGIICGVIGSFIILRGMALMGECNLARRLTWSCDFLYVRNQFLLWRSCHGCIDIIGNRSHQSKQPD